MSKNLTDLNNHLFAQLDRLSKSDISEDELAHEMQRTSSMVCIAKEVVSNAKLVFEAEKFRTEFNYNGNGKKLPPMLEAKG